MKKLIARIGSGIINKRTAVLVTALILSCAAAFCMPKVNINDDMTEYLPDDSNMKAGVDIMKEDFPEEEVNSTVRVMFTGLSDGQKAEVLTELESLKYVKSVTYEEDSEYYNKGDHTKYILNIPYKYSTDEEKAVEAALDTEFTGYDMVWKSDNENYGGIPTPVIIGLIVILMTILFLMCGSWIEPFLFLAVIGMAILMNMGSNVLLGMVSTTTYSIAAILQLVLSMDYSIILMDRYRQERMLISDKVTAMKTAWVNAFPSVASSAMTTVVGLLMMVFMSFKIGMDIGTVLAKGVFISMLCVMTILPGVILIFDKLVVKTAKKSLHVPMNWAAKFSYKLRHLMTPFLVLLFIAAFLMQQQTGISYSFDEEDPIADVFPATTTMVVVYNNDDEDEMPALIRKLEADENIRSVTGYSNTLGQEFNAKELTEAIEEMSDDFALGEDVIRMLYYDYHMDGETGTMTAGEFISFISGDVSENETFSEYIDGDIKANLQTMKKFSDPAKLTTDMSAKQLASFFGMKESDVKDMMLLYQMENKNTKTGEMTLPEFAAMINTLAADPQYSSMFDEETADGLAQLALFTDVQKMTAPCTYDVIASMLGMDTEAVKLLYTYYYAMSGEYEPASMTLGEFINFMMNDVAANPAFSGYMDESMMAQMQQALQMIDPAMYQMEFSYDQIAAMFGMDAATARMLYVFHDSKTQLSSWKLSMQTVINFLMANQEMPGGAMNEEQAAGLSFAQKIINSSVNGTEFSVKEMSALTGVNQEQIRQIYLLDIRQNGDTSDWKLSVSEFVDFIAEDIMGNKEYAGYIDPSMSADLRTANTLIDAVVSQKQYDAGGMYRLFADLADGMDSNMMELVYLYYFSDRDYDAAWTMSLDTLFAYLADDVISDPRFDDLIDEDAKGTISDAREELEEGKEQLVSRFYSRLVIEAFYPEESAETTAFLADLEKYCDSNLDHRSFLIGNAALNYEMQKTFDSELLFITMLTALAIFLIVAITFRSLSIPLILVLLIQCSVYITVTATGIISGSINYLALLIVECILMGATIDYGILMTNNYCAARFTEGIKESLKTAYAQSIHTVLTSGSILVIVTATMGGLFGEPTIAAIVKTISIGSFSAIMLILFVLPGVLAACDRVIIRRKKHVVDAEIKEENLLS